MSDSFSIIFRGDILPGHNLPEVKAKMAQLFKLNDAKLATVFSGKPVALKQNCDAATATKLKAALNKVGADVQVKSSTPPPASSAQSAAAAAPSKPASPAPQAQSAPPPPPLPEVNEDPVSPPPKPVAPAATPAPPPTASNPDEAGIAPMSGDLMSESEKAAMRPEPVDINTDHIKMEKRVSTFALPDDEPLPGEEAQEVDAPDFGLFEVGADLLNESEKTTYEELALDLSAISMAEVGADVLNEDEKQKLPEVEVADLEADIAPAGSDMGQIKKEPPPPPPNTDHLSTE